MKLIKLPSFETSIPRNFYEAILEDIPERIPGRISGSPEGISGDICGLIHRGIPG